MRASLVTYKQAVTSGRYQTVPNACICCCGGDIPRILLRLYYQPNGDLNEVERYWIGKIHHFVALSSAVHEEGIFNGNEQSFRLKNAMTEQLRIISSLLAKRDVFPVVDVRPHLEPD